MKKQNLFSFISLFIGAFLLTACEKTKSVTNEKIPVKKSVAKEETLSQKTPPTKITTKAEEEEKIAEKEKSVATGEPPATDNQKFEGSQSLKRYMTD